MANHVYKSVELTGSSTTSCDDAIRAALKRASRTLRNIKWFEVVSTRGQVEAGDVVHWQVTIKAGFTLDE